MNTIGTPFKSEDERTQRKVDRINKKPWEQEVRDEKGRKRFHGAFTGGFSAGYFNSVGSKEGWAPSNFVSSRDKNKPETSKNIMDFMDEEDINEQIGVHTITSKDEYKDQTFFQPDKSNAISHTHSIFSNDHSLLNELIPNYNISNNSVSNKLMISAGYDESRGRIKEIDNKYYKGKLDFKDDYFGIGYTPQYDEAMNHVNNKKDKDMMSSNRVKMDKFEDQADMGFFNSNDISGYNFEEIDVEDSERKGGSRIKANFDVSSYPRFNKSYNKLKSTSEIKFEMPKLPENYDPFKKKEILISINNLNSQSNKNKNYSSMTPEKRSELLMNDDNSNKYLKSKFTSFEDIKKEKNVLKPPSSTDQIENYFNFKIDIPFKQDLAKVSRFAKFIAEKEGMIIGDSSYTNMMTGSQIRDERNLFENLYETEQSIKRAEQNLNNEIKKNKDSEINLDNSSKDDTESKNENEKEKENKGVIREKIKWQPEKLLCKRFKVKDPFENLVHIQGDKTKGLSDLQSSLLKEENRNLNFSKNYQVPRHTPKDSNRESKSNNSNSNLELIKQINNDTNSFILINAKPDINIYEEIFG